MVLGLLAAGVGACTPSPPPGGDPPPSEEPAAAAASAEPAEPEHAPALPAPVALPSDPGEAGVRAFVTEFMEARIRGDQPRSKDFLSPGALELYSGGPGGLVLTGTPGLDFTAWELVSLQQADANSYEAKVLIRQEGAGQETVTFEETLFIGPGPDASDTQRVWIVRGGARKP